MKELTFDFDKIQSFIDDIPDFSVEELLVADDNKPVQPKRKKITREYINNSDFCDALVKYKADCLEASNNGKPKPNLPNYIGECFMKLADGLSRRPNFFGYSYKDEMIADGIENCLTYCHNFDVEKTSNPFAYFTQILWWCFVRRIKKEKKQQYIKYKATENFGVLDEAELMELGEGQIKQLEVYDNMYEFIQKFEEAEFGKSKKPTAKKKKKNVGIESFLEE